MLEFPRWKILLVVCVCLWGILQALPNLLPEETRTELSFLPQDTMNLGLDLRGGSYLLLQVDMDIYLHEQLEQLLDDVRRRMREKRLGYRGLAVKDGVVIFTLRNRDDDELLSDALSDLFRDVETDIASNGNVTLRYREKYIEQMKKMVIEQSIEIVRRRVDETGTREPIIQRQGDERILLQVPGLQDPEQLKRLLGKTAKMTFHLMSKTNPYPQKMVHPPSGEQIVPGKEGQLYMIKRKVELSGDLLVDARASFQQGEPIVNFRFNTQGGKRFGQITRENVNKPFAIVLDGVVLTAPRINEPILGGAGMISGSFTVQSANDLALLLRAGALPAPLHILEERTVGPSLGQDSINAGKAAALVGIILVIAMIILFYGLFGLFSTLALAMNMVLIVAVLSLFQATLTLPGIAGMVLTMGMAVDANVLIFERIREEVRVGKTPFAAIDHGFRQAFKTILDSNITTLIATLLLFIYGSGPVKGFAVTLSAGILCSMFSAILLTRLMIILWLKRTRPKTIPL